MRTRTKRTVLVLHIVSCVGWIGVDLALLPLVITGLTTDDGQTAATAYRAIAILAPWTIPVLSTLILVTGVLLGLGTRWGLKRYWWVLVKLGISILLAVLVWVALLPGVAALEVTDATTGDQVRAALADPTMFLYPPVVSSLLLTVAVVLSVFKPWGRRGEGKVVAVPATARRSRSGRAG